MSDLENTKDSIIFTQRFEQLENDINVEFHKKGRTKYLVQTFENLTIDPSNTYLKNKPKIKSLRHTLRGKKKIGTLSYKKSKRIQSDLSKNTLITNLEDVNKYLMKGDNKTTDNALNNLTIDNNIVDNVIIPTTIQNMDKTICKSSKYNTFPTVQRKPIERLTIARSNSLHNSSQIVKIDRKWYTNSNEDINNSSSYTSNDIICSATKTFTNSIPNSLHLKNTDTVQEIERIHRIRKEAQQLGMLYEKTIDNDDVDEIIEAVCSGNSDVIEGMLPFCRDWTELNSQESTSKLLTYHDKEKIQIIKDITSANADTRTIIKIEDYYIDDDTNTSTSNNEKATLIVENLSVDSFEEMEKLVSTPNSSMIKYTSNKSSTDDIESEIYEEDEDNVFDTFEYEKLGARDKSSSVLNLIDSYEGANASNHKKYLINNETADNNVSLRKKRTEFYENDDYSSDCDFIFINADEVSAYLSDSIKSEQDIDSKVLQKTIREIGFYEKKTNSTKSTLDKLDERRSKKNYNISNKQETIEENTIKTGDYNMNVVRKTLVRPRSIKEQKQYIIEELISTERKYISTLNYIIQQYSKPLKSYGKEIGKNPKNVLVNIDVIIAKSSKFFEDIMKNKHNYEEIGNVFLRHAALFDEYVTYYYYYNRDTLNLITGHFRPVIQKRDLELKEKLGLSSFLLAPIQRLGKYELLLRNLIKCMTKENANFESLLKAKELIINYTLKGEQAILLSSFDKELKSTVTGNFITKDMFKWLPKKIEVMLYLFDNIVIMAKPSEKKGRFNVKLEIPTNSLSIRNIQGSLMLELEDFDKKSKGKKPISTLLEAHDQKTKEYWATTLDKLLWKQLEDQKKLATNNT